jgi:hypothetical protein
MYCRLDNDVVVEIFDYNPFEWIPNPAFLANCMECPDDVKQGYIHKDGVFADPNNKNPTELREAAYETMITKADGTDLIPWEGKEITVDQANKVYLEYSAEGSTKAVEIQALIVAAKTYIRELYPDNNAD